MLLKDEVMQQNAKRVAVRTTHTNINFKLSIRFSFLFILAVSK